MKSHLPAPLALAWMKLLASTVCSLYYRILIHGAVPARRGRILFVGLHRNGAIDGWVHLTALGGDIAFLVGANLKRNPFTRLLTVGIAVERHKDSGDRSSNPAALDAAVDWLEQGGDLFVFPEGTSDLGPAPLAFHKGAARIACAALGRGMELRVIPVGIDYAAPETPGSAVDVVIGSPLDLCGAPAALEIMHQAISRALLSVAFVFAGEAEQQAARLAAVRDCAGDVAVRAAALSLRALQAPRLGRGTPISRIRWPGGRSLLREHVAHLFVILGAAFNLPVFAGGWLAARLMADAQNVVALWRIVSGLFLAPLWWAASALIAERLFGPPGWFVPPLELALGALALRSATVGS